MAGLNLRGDTSGSVEIKAPDIAGDNTLTLPNTDGTLIVDATSGGVSVADSISHTGDTDTAIRFPAADTFTVETAGSERVRIDSSGNVGIGTDNPSATLVVGGISQPETSRGAVAIKAQATDTPLPFANMYLEEPDGGEGYYLSVNSVGDLDFVNSGNSTVLTLADDDNVGVGSTIPARKLDVVDSGANGAVVRSQVTDNNGGYLAYEALNSSGTSVFSVSHNGRINLAEGINFQNTGAGSSTGATSHILDDYEEGTWTPTTTNFTHTTDATECRYTKIGRMVYLTGQLSRDQASSPTSAMIVITGLPFSQSTVTRSISGNFWLDNGGYTTDYIGGITYSNNSTDILFAISTNPAQQSSARYIQGNYFNDTRGILFSMTYITD